jgi:Thermolysin metallopeptidase, alpha-helical domain
MRTVHWLKRKSWLRHRCHVACMYTIMLTHSLTRHMVCNYRFSDIMGAAADRLVGSKSIPDVWRIGEDFDIWISDGQDGIRDMKDPPILGQPDHYSGELEVLRPCEVE